jgi:hypothetical protein
MEKIQKEAGTGRPTLIYTTTCREVIRERDPRKEIVAYRQGDTPTGGAIILTRIG